MRNNTSVTDNLFGDGKLGATISDAAHQVTEKVGDMSRTAASKIDENREATAGGLHRAASALHDKAEDLPGGERIASLAHAAADKLRCTADYVRDHDVRRMMADVTTLVKNNPGRSLLVAAAMGFLVGRAVRNHNRG